MEPFKWSSKMANPHKSYKSSEPVMIDAKLSYNPPNFRIPPRIITLKMVSTSCSHLFRFLFIFFFEGFHWKSLIYSLIDSITDEIYSVTTQAIQQEEIEHEEEVDPNHIQATILDESEIIETEELEEEEMEAEEIEETVYALEMEESSDCEDKEYVGKLTQFIRNTVFSHDPASTTTTNILNLNFLSYHFIITFKNRSWK